LDAPPIRTDLGKIPNYRIRRHRLQGEQDELFRLPSTLSPSRSWKLIIDHFLPQAKGDRVGGLVRVGDVTASG